MQENTRYKQYGNTKDWYTLQSFLMSFCSVAANDLCIIIKASVFIIARFIPENCQKKKKKKVNYLSQLYACIPYGLHLLIILLL